MAYIFYSLPTFWLGLILIYFFGVRLKWLPPQGIVDAGHPARLQYRALLGGFGTDPMPKILDIGKHLILPVITLVAGQRGR